MQPRILRNAIDILSTLVAAYEKANFPIEIPDPIEAIQYYNEKIVRSTRMAIVLSAIVIFVLAMPQFLKLQYLCNFPL
jgi:antitoxin component HigA of HigAB toxin-antitoxin module